MQIEFSNADTTVQLPQSLDSVSLQAPGPLRIEDDGAGVLPAATTLDTGTGLSATDQGDGIVRLDAAASGSGVDVTDSGAAVQTDVTGIDFGSGLSASDDGDGTVTVSASAQNGVGVEDSGASILSTATSLNFGTALSVVDDGDGTVTIDGEATDPAGSDTQIQFNDAGSFGASSGLTFDTGTLTVQGDGTLLDLQDSDGDSVTVSSGATSFQGEKGVIISTEGSGFHPGRIPIDTDGKKPIFTERARFDKGIDTSSITAFGQGPILINSNNGVEWMQDNNVTATLNEDKYFGVGLSNPTATITAQAKSGQTDPLLQLNDETGSRLLSVKKDPKDAFNIANPKLNHTIDLNWFADFVGGTDTALIQARLTPGAHFGFENDGGDNIVFSARTGEIEFKTNNRTLQSSITSDGDYKFHQGGKGVILTSEDGSTTKRVYLDQSGSLATEPA